MSESITFTSVQYSELIKQEDLTKNWVTSVNQLKTWKIHSWALSRILSIHVPDGYEDIIHYLFTRYYQDGLSFRDISSEIKIPVKTISNWFSRYFNWETREFIWTHTDRTREKRKKSMIASRNGVKTHEDFRVKIDKIVKEVQRDINQEVWDFDYDTYQASNTPSKKINMVLEFAEYWENYLDDLIRGLYSEWHKAPTIAHVINTLVWKLIVLLGLKIQETPEINRATIHNKIKSD